MWVTYLLDVFQVYEDLMEMSKLNNVVSNVLNYRPCIQISLQVANSDLMSTQNDNTSFWSQNSFRDLLKGMKTMTISAK